jgi:hypothetical protein
MGILAGTSQRPDFLMFRPRLNQRGGATSGQSRSDLRTTTRVSSFFPALGATLEALTAAFCRLGKSLSCCWEKGWLVGAVGIEPTTFGLKGRCSTTELRP